MFHRYRTHDEDSSKIVDVPSVQVVDKIMDVPVTKQRQCLAVKKKQVKPWRCWTCGSGTHPMLFLPIQHLGSVSSLTMWGKE